jgi:hypothetical protein
MYAGCLVARATSLLQSGPPNMHPYLNLLSEVNHHGCTCKPPDHALLPRAAALYSISKGSLGTVSPNHSRWSFSAHVTL